VFIIIIIIISFIILLLLLLLLLLFQVLFGLNMIVSHIQMIFLSLCTSCTGLLCRTQLFCLLYSCPAYSSTPRMGQCVATYTRFVLLNICDQNLDGRIILKCVLNKKICKCVNCMIMAELMTVCGFLRTQ
jgi:hypothetical protein